MSLERKLGVLGISLAALLSCGAEGSSAKGCKDDNDCKGDRYCDESTGQCVSEEAPAPSETDTTQPAQLKTILDEEFDGSSLDIAEWKKYCFTWQDAGCTEVAAGDDYFIDKGILKVNYGGMVFATPFKLGDGKLRVEYKRRNEDFDYAIHGIRDIAGETMLLFWNGLDDDSGFTAGAGVSQGRNEYDMDKELYIDENPHTWHVFKIEADASQAVFTADSDSAAFSTKELDEQNELYVWLDGGEYDYVKVWTE